MPAEQFTSPSELEGHLQAALIQSVEAIHYEAEQGGSSLLFSDEHQMSSDACYEYNQAVVLARAGWWVSKQVPLWWIEIITDDATQLHDARRWLMSRRIKDGIVCLFYSLSDDDVLQGRLVLMSEDKELSALFRTMFDH